MGKLKNKTQVLQQIKNSNKKAIKVIDSCQDENHIKGAKKYLNLLENRNIDLIEKLLGVHYFNNSRAITNNYLPIFNITQSFNKIQMFLKVKEQQIRSYEKY